MKKCIESEKDKVRRYFRDTTNLLQAENPPLP